MSDDEIYLSATRAAMHLTNGSYQLEPTFGVTKRDGKNVAIAPGYVAKTEAEDKRVWAYIDSLPEGVRDLVASGFIRLEDKWDAGDLSTPTPGLFPKQPLDMSADEAMTYLREHFQLKKIDVLLKGAGGLGQPDEISFIASLWAGVNEEEEVKVWKYINSLPPKVKYWVEKSFTRLENEHVPSKE